MKPMDTDRRSKSAGGAAQPSATGGEMAFKQRRSDRRGEGGIFGYEGPDRRSGTDRRQRA